MHFLKNIAKSILRLVHYVFWLFQYTRMKLRGNGSKDIKILSIEFASVCNLRCTYCFLEQNDRDRFLDINIYEKLIKEVAQSPKYHIRTMEWSIKYSNPSSTL